MFKLFCQAGHKTVKEEEIFMKGSIGMKRKWILCTAVYTFMRAAA
jgi:hypothetical protein